MKKNILHYLKTLIQAGAIFLILSIITDLYRQPDTRNIPQQHRYPLLSGASALLPPKHTSDVTVVYFWGSWCAICKYTSPAIERLHQNHIPVISVAIRSGSDDSVKNYMQSHQINFPAINDSDGLIARNWGINATPGIVLIKKGKPVHYTFGFSSYWGLSARIQAAQYFL